MTDYLLMTSIDDVQMHWTKLLGEQAGYTIDAVQRDVVTAGTGNVIYSNGTSRTDVNTIIDGNDLDRAIRDLMNDGAEMLLGGNNGSTTVGSSPVMPAFPAVTHYDVLFDLQNISGFKSAEQYRGAAEGEIGRYKNLAFFCAPDPSALNAGAKKFANGGGTAPSGIKSTGGSSADVYTIMIFGKHGFTRVPISGGSTKMYRKPLGSAGALDPIEQVGTIGWKYSGSRLITNQNWLSRIECGASS